MADRHLKDGRVMRTYRFGPETLRLLAALAERERVR
jgi:hypothetical protein